MPKSFASSPFAPSRRRPAAETARGRLALGRLTLAAIGLLALAALAAGCGGARQPFYTPDQVQAAFDAEGIAVYARNQPIPRFSTGPQAPPSLDEAAPVTEPLTALLNGVRAAVLGPTKRRPEPPVTFGGLQLSIYVYPREQDARQKASDLADTLGALEILHRVNLGFERKGNVVVAYRVFAYRYQRGIPGFPDAQDTIEAYEGHRHGSVAAALSRLP